MNSDVNSRFHGRLDLSKVGLFGQSFGGATATEACSVDARCKAAVDIDGNLFGNVLQQGVKQPLLFVLSDWTLHPPWLQKTLASVSVERFRQEQVQLNQQMQDVCQESAHCWKVHIPGTRHFNFTDLPFLYSPGMRMMGYLGPVDGAKGLAETSSCVRLFFDKILKPPSDSPLPQLSRSDCHVQPLGHSPADLQSVPQ